MTTFFFSRSRIINIILSFSVYLTGEGRSSLLWSHPPGHYACSPVSLTICLCISLWFQNLHHWNANFFCPCTDVAQTWLILTIWTHWLQVHFNIGVRNRPRSLVYKMTHFIAARNFFLNIFLFYHNIYTCNKLQWLNFDFLSILNNSKIKRSFHCINRTGII